MCGKATESHQDLGREGVKKYRPAAAIGDESRSLLQILLSAGRCVKKLLIIPVASFPSDQRVIFSGRRRERR